MGSSTRLLLREFCLLVNRVVEVFMCCDVAVRALLKIFILENHLAVPQEIKHSVTI